MAKVLIIKLGHSETLDAEVSETVSLGDVLRSTVVLHQLKNDQVTWLVDQKAYPLLVHNPYIQRLLVYNDANILQLQSEEFDVVINLEKVPALCALADRTRAGRKCGFSFDPLRGEARCYAGSEVLSRLCKDIDAKRANRQPWQKTLVELVGGRWSGQEYVLGYKPKTRKIYDCGLNYAVGEKWPIKAWPMPYWKQLDVLLKRARLAVDWQKGLSDLYQYMDWINSCETLITSDSLGLHVALALGKKAVVIYGPTNSHEIFMYGRGVGVTPSESPCAPCISAKCTSEVFCLDTITPKMVFYAYGKFVLPDEPRHYFQNSIVTEV